MSLPNSLNEIFRKRQKSYKMVLMLALLDEMGRSIKKVSIYKVAERFLAYFKNREDKGLVVDNPPGRSAWREININQIFRLLDTPIEALSNVLTVDKDSIGFVPSLHHQLDDTVTEELRKYANDELEKYYNYLRPDIPLRESLLYIMKNYLEAKLEPFSSHSIANFVRHKIITDLKQLPFISEHYKVEGSVGKGNWANIPWIAIMNKIITESTQQGVYICYLFSEDMKSVYLTLAQGVTKPILEMGKKKGYEYLQRRVNELRNDLPLDNLMKNGDIFLTSKGLGQDYQVSTIAYKKYDYENMPENEVIIHDLENVMMNYQLYINTLNDRLKGIDKMESNLIEKNCINQIKNYIRSRGFSYPSTLIDNFYLSLKTKPFLILAGISGTGKTRLVKLFAESVGATQENGQFTLIPVRPDWSDPSDLIGYIDLSKTFRPGQLTEVLLKASQPDNRNKPYFICLDEMNLARVEHYFSDLLSIMETQRWSNGEIVTDPVINKLLLKDTFSNSFDVLIPDNVYLIGTVNMDETTYPFSKKVLDRANTIEFNYVNLADMPELSKSDVVETPIVVENTLLRSDYLILQDAMGLYGDIIKKSTEQLIKINEILEEIHANIGFRVRDAICFYMIYNQRFGLMDESTAFDLQLHQKILPRVQGSSSAVKQALIQLMFICTGEQKNIEVMIEDASELYLPWKKSNQSLNVSYPQSARKIAYMLRRLEEDGFTSYWIS